MQYEDSQISTVTVPAVGVGDPATLYRAAKRVMRILVRNSGGSPILLAHDASALQVLGAAGTYLLPSGQADVFVLMPQQALIAASVGVAGQASIAASVALPIHSEG